MKCSKHTGHPAVTQRIDQSQDTESVTANHTDLCYCLEVNETMCVCVRAQTHTVLQCIPIGGESEPELGTEDY